MTCWTPRHPTTGRATIVASKDQQPALEGYKGHGIFTYALLHALSDADQEKVTSVHEIASYVDEHVPEIAFQAFGYEQIPQVNTHGPDFLLEVVR